MFCVKCGKQLPQDSNFCPYCGAKFDEASSTPPETDLTVDDEQDETANQEISSNSVADDFADTEEPDSEPLQKDEGIVAETPDEGSPSFGFGSDTQDDQDFDIDKPHGDRKGLKIAAVVAAVVAVIAIGAVAYISSHPTLLAPEITDEEALQDFEPTISAAGYGIDESWGSTEDLEYKSAEVTSTAEPDVANDSVIYKYVTAIYENQDYQVYVYYADTYQYENDTWTRVDRYENGFDVKPLGGISDEAIIAHVPTMMQVIDADSEKARDENLQALYQANTSFTVTENNTDTDGGTATIAISALSGFKGYSGTITADFSWDYTEDSGVETWVIDSASVDDGAYEVSYDTLIGTWTGTLTSTSSHSKECYGGRNSPPTITIKSVDNTAKTITLDITCLVHVHSYVTGQDVETSDGDQLLSFNNVLATLDDKKISLYRAEDPTDFEFILETGDDGSLQLTAETYTKYESIMSSDPISSSRTDIYKLSKTA